MNPTEPSTADSLWSISQVVYEPDIAVHWLHSLLPTGFTWTNDPGMAMLFDAHSAAERAVAELTTVGETHLHIHERRLTPQPLPSGRRRRLPDPYAELERRGLA